MDDTTADRRPHRDQLAEVRTNATETGRVNQKLRTRQALIDAATELFGRGGTPTLAEIAEHALVSKTTAYRYFASVDALVTEVFFNSYFPRPEDVLEVVGDEPTARVLAVEAAVNDALLAQERAMRVVIRNAIDMSLGAEADGPHRVGRRMRLIDAALDPLEGRIDPSTIRRLREALALVIGPEAILAARDVLGLDADGTREATAWAAEALVAHALGGSPTARSSTSAS